MFIDASINNALNFLGRSAVVLSLLRSKVNPSKHIKSLE